MKEQTQILQKLETVEELMKAETLKPLNLKEAANYLSISKSHLYKLTHKKLLPFFKPMGKLAYFRKSDLDAFIYRNRQGTDLELEAQANNIIDKRKGVRC